MLELQAQDGKKFVTLRFEHSLLSLSKWESIHKKAFISRRGLSPAEQIDYFMCMLLNTDVNKSIVSTLKPDQLEALWDYINTSQTATSFSRDENQKGASSSQTSEELYAMLTALEIDWRCETWHLTRVTALIEAVTNLKTPPKKKSRMENLQDIMRIRKQNEEIMKSNNG